MKTTKILFSAVAGVLLAASAQAQPVDIYLSGAVAFRDSSYRAIRSLYGANLANQNPAAPAGSPEGSALKVTYTGTIPSLYGARVVTVYTFYNGAVAGIQNLTANNNVIFLTNSVAGDTNSITHTANLALSSVFQASTTFTTPTLADTKFGVTPVVWLKSTSAPSGLTNITSQQIKVFEPNGAIYASYFTGETNNAGGNGTNLVYFISRDTSAGQRIITAKDSSFNAGLVTGGLLSYYFTNSAWSSTTFPDGVSATSFIISQLNTVGTAISYLTLVDAIQVNGGANILTYNGQKPFRGTFTNGTNDFTPVITGQYSLWGYEHLLARTADVASPTADLTKFRDALLTALGNVLTTNSYSIPVNKVKVQRFSDGGPISPL